MHWERGIGREAAVLQVANIVRKAQGPDREDSLQQKKGLFRHFRRLHCTHAVYSVRELRVEYAARLHVHLLAPGSAGFGPTKSMTRSRTGMMSRADAKLVFTLLSALQAAG
eukprot:717837-Amphidinium_carterae.1